MKRLHYKSFDTYIFMQLGNVATRSCCLRPLDSTTVLLVLVRDSLHEMYVLASLHHKYIFQITARDITLLCGFDHFSTSLRPLFIIHVGDRRGCGDLISRDANKVFLLQPIPHLPYAWLEYTDTSIFCWPVACINC